tara:strand:+ start:11321 stop:11722 length:402 start_codon:yes stop_codon:yes gene_type:complete
MSTFSDAFAEETEFEVLPEGSYTTRLLEVKSEANPFDGIMQTTLAYEVKDGTYQSRRIWDTVKHEDAVAWKAARIFRSFGIQGQPEDWNQWGSAINECVGKLYDVEVIHRSNNAGDKTYVNVKRVSPTDEIPF